MAKEIIVLERSSLNGLVTAVNTELAAHDEHYLRKLTFDVGTIDHTMDRKYRATLLFESGAPALTAPFELLGYEGNYLEGNDGVGKLAQDDITATYGSAYVQQFYGWVGRDVSVEDLHVLLMLINPSLAEGASHYGY